jgi:pimeloyl-ACP methyl ester carboxylesterase/DNA-binding CsgD family transcriptional regulator
MKQEIRFCHSSDGVRIAYATTGTGPPLARVANWLTHLNLDWQSPVWSHWFEELSRGNKLLRYDPRGTGLSDRQVETFSLEAWVHDLEAVLDDQGNARFNLLGFCQGGPIAIAYAARHPERVNRLVIYDSYAFGAFTAGVPPAMKRKAAALAEMIEVGWGQHAVAFRQIFSNLLIPRASTPQQRWFSEFERRTVSPQSAVRLWRAFHELDVRDLAPKVQAPTLVFHVRNDAMVPFEAGLRLAALIPNARFVPLEGDNHILLADDPAWPRFLEEMRSFLSTKITSEAPQVEAAARFSELTARELEVLELIAQGLSNDRISDCLYITIKTVRNHITHLYSKLGIASRSQAIILAREAGLGQRKDINCG